MINLITNFLEPVSYFIYLIAFLFHSFTTGKLSEKVPLLFYLFGGVLMVYASYLARNLIENVFIYNYLLLPASVLFFSWYFKTNFHNRKRKRIVIWIFTLNALLFLLRAIFLEQNHMFDSIGFTTLSLSILVFCFIFFKQRLQEVSEKPIFGNFNFWVICSFFISFSGSFLVFLTYYYLTEKISTSYVYANRHLLTLLWGVPNILLFAGSLFALIGSIWTNYHRK
ncbi:MAG TPA: hypothetical protein VLS85_06395 [Hanamia sp.]|nr:hypothetical protein [Hanamia sp.]